MSSVQITQEKQKALVEELNELKTQKRPMLLERLQTAKELGDLSENAEYHASRDAQGKNEDRIKEIEAILRQAVIIKKSNSEEVTLTSVATVKKDGDDTERTFTLVSPQEADTSSGKLSAESPIGAALMGKKKGDLAQIETPSGSTTWHILDVN